MQASPARVNGQAATPAATPVLTQTQNADVPALKAQLGELRIQLAGLQSQWDGLQNQLNNMLRNNPARPGVQQQWADVGVQKAKLEGDIASLQARIAMKEGRLPPASNTGFPSVPPPWLENGAVIVPAAAVLTLVLAFPISIAFAKRILRRAPAPAATPSDVSMRLERIEHAVDAIAIEVERVSESQRFMTKVMAGRQPAPAPAAEGAGPAEAAQVQPKQPLALGAGPLEPIIAAERERVGMRPSSG